jgi:hypothetical protein
VEGCRRWCAGLSGLLAAVTHAHSPEKVLIAHLTSATSLHNKQPVDIIANLFISCRIA